MPIPTLYISAPIPISYWYQYSPNSYIIPEVMVVTMSMSEHVDGLDEASEDEF